MPFLPQAHISGVFEVQQVGTICSDFSPLENCHADASTSIAKFAFAVFIIKRLVEDGWVFLIRSWSENVFL